MRALAFAAALLLASCTYGPTVRTDFDPSANFHAYRTYSWLQSDAPRGMNPLMFARLRGSIDRELTARGYTQSPGAGDFAVSFTIGERDRVRVWDYPSYGWGGWGWGGWGGWGGGWGGWGGWGWGYPYERVSIDQYTERSVIIDIFDGPTRRPVWHGIGTNVEYSDYMNFTKLDQAVVAALAKFPPQPAVPAG